MNTPVKNKILIVDDEKANLLYLNNLLSGEYTLSVALNGAEAVEIAGEFLPDLILLDIIMPDMDGYEVFSELKKGEKTRAIPVIFISGLTRKEEETKGLEMGADDYINKPFLDAVVQLRIRNQLKIVNQMRDLDKQLKQQTLMTSLVQSFLAGGDSGSQLANTLRLTGEFMDLAQALFFVLEEDGVTLNCQSEWINPKLGIGSRIGDRMLLREPVLSVIKGLRPGMGKEACLNSNEPAFKEAMAPYRINFQNYITTPFFVNGEITGVLDFSKETGDENWSDSEINLTALFASILSGVFERKTMENTILAKGIAERSSNAKSEFLSRMSHEIRTPLNAIIGMTNLAQHADDPVKRYAYLDKSAAASRDLLRLIEDVLDVSDFRDGKLELKKSAFRFDAMIKRVLKDANLVFERKSQIMTADIDSSIPEILIGDEIRLSQVINNLLSNAGKFTQERGLIQVKAAVINKENNNLVIQIDITDNGIGIPKNKIDIIFTAFEQIDGGIDRKYEGVGIGLYLSKTIVEMMGGKIWVETEPGKGSRFSFTFQTQIQDTSGIPASFSGKTTLLVDDIEINREIIMAILEESQMKFICAENGRNAVDIFSSEPEKIDLILMDINMPEMDGIEATRRIRNLNTPQAGSVPIIAVTANTNPEDVKKYFAAGMTDYLKKPADFSEVLQKISRYLNRS